MFVTKDQKADGLKAARELVGCLQRARDIFAVLPRCDDAGTAYMLMSAVNRVDMALEAVRLYGRSLTNVVPDTLPSGKVS